MPSLEAILDRKAKGLSQSAIANELGTSVGVVAGMIWRHKHNAPRDSEVTETSGTSTMTVDTLPFGGVSWSYHNFVQTEGAMWTQYGDGLIQVDDIKQAGQAAA